ncbi:uroporphyrinogen-III synthase [Sphingomonas sp.]|uniref:uroporphyrinogen-III synthase n=1 Tax=Sphingomonas sp. TaxID=28214 RepID=UPI0025E6B8B2|nr:uroporphyrinogen-III synthase [Sphingomonas sp.]MBV9527294.1 uroporphyrinogen-III synthase [Sphingomonas sp.]
MSRVIVLRPEPGANETVERARALEIDALSVPLFAVERVDWEVPEAGGFDALLLTSANAVRCAGDQLRELRGLPVHAVGKATADAARDAGFDITSSGDAGVERLLGSLEADLKLLHLCGEDRAVTGETRQAITAVTVYRSEPLEPPPDLTAIAGGVALVHSPRAGKRLAELAVRQGLDRGDVAIAAISAAAADAAGHGWKSVDHADQPTDEALLAVAGRLCDKRRQ